MKSRDRAVKLRLERQSCFQLAAETDSKKEDRLLREEAAELSTQLVACCPHEDTIVTQSAYEGSSCMDYDDGHPEHRLCLCCGTEERGKNKSSMPRPDTFEVLTSKPIARFESQRFQQDKNIPVQVRDCMSYLLSEVVDLALEHGYKVFRMILPTPIECRM